MDFTTNGEWQNARITAGLEQNLVLEEEKAQAAIRPGNQQTLLGLPANIAEP